MSLFQQPAKIKLAVLASGAGTNLEAIIDAAKKESFPAFVGVVVSDNQSAGALKRARHHRVPAVFIDPKLFGSRKDYDQMLIATLKEYKAEFIILAGFMRILSSLFVQMFSKHILNIHPSLLPKYPGLSAVQRALEAGEKETGCTVHYVDEGVDTGPVVLQQTVPILPDDTVERLHQRIHEAEHKLYPKAIESVILKDNLRHADHV